LATATLPAPAALSRTTLPVLALTGPTRTAPWPRCTASRRLSGAPAPRRQEDWHKAVLEAVEVLERATAEELEDARRLPQRPPRLTPPGGGSSRADGFDKSTQVLSAERPEGRLPPSAT
jgi:hypothetical protein